MPSKNLSRNGRLEQAMADLAAAQAQMVANQAAFQANFIAMQSRIDAQLARIDEKFSRIDAQFADIRAILTGHETQFQTILATLAGLPEAVQRRIGFREPEAQG